MTLSWYFRDERDATALAALAYVGVHGALVPPLWNVEIGHTLVKAERRGRITRDQSATILASLRSLPILVESGGDSPAFPQLALARAYDLSGYDAAYLELAMRIGIPLATRDEHLATKAEQLRLRWTATLE